MKIRKYIGDKAFYRMVLGVALPIMIQNGISTFVSMLDNIMVGRVGTEAMSGVSVVNQFLFIFNLLIFGAVSAAGIFMSQFHGQADREGERFTFRFKFLICSAAGIIGIAVLWIFSDQLISLFLGGSASDGDPALTLRLGREYLYIMLIGLIPFVIANVYASSMRETGDTLTPMAASIVSVVTNFVLNYLLIFGNFGLPELGVRGAAIATVIARTAECLILMIRTHSVPAKYAYIKGAFRSFYIPGKLFCEIVLRGLPLMLNELFWSLSVTLTNQCYSTRGLDVVASQSIYTTIFDVFSVVYLAMGTAISIVVGNLLGAGETEQAKDTDRKMIAFSVFCSAVTGILLTCFSGLFPRLYNTTDGVRDLASFMIIIAAAAMPFTAFTNAAYFTIRSGGQVMLTILFDSVFMWTVVMPVCWSLTTFTQIGIRWLFVLTQFTEATKSLLGYVLLRRGTWVRTLKMKQ